jgi:hypothetical protein
LVLPPQAGTGVSRCRCFFAQCCAKRRGGGSIAQLEIAGALIEVRTPPHGGCHQSAKFVPFRAHGPMYPRGAEITLVDERLARVCDRR